ncbi:MAG: hypothetical protein U0528_08100 [Anaerolineae bacterium]
MAFPNTTPLTYIFISSIFAAAAASTGWCVLTGNSAGLAGVALDYITIFVPMSLFSFQISGIVGSGAALFGAALITGAVFGIGLFLWSRRLPIRDAQPTPPLVRWSFIVFVIALVAAGIALVLKLPNNLPWTLTPELSVVAGWIFIGAAAYFGYGVLRPGWFNAGGQLAGFLAYDIVLIVPFMQRLPTVADEFRFGLYFYTVVVSYSGLLAIYYLFINRATRVKIDMSEGR